MTAERIFYDKVEYPDGAILEMRIWRVPERVAGSKHTFKYSLFYGYPGRRLVGYDNERGKGDHRHSQGSEHTYYFTSPNQLVADFLLDVKKERGG